MAQRGGPARRIPGNPLGSVVREVQRKSRTVTGPLSGGSQSLWSGLVPTDSNGLVSVSFPYLFKLSPVVQATAQSANPLVVSVGSVTTAGVTLRVWALDGSAANAGTIVHVTARERT